jgi:predicted lipoprotein
MIWRSGDTLAAADRALSGVETLLRSRRFTDLPAAMVALERAMQSLQGGGIDRSAAARLTDMRRRAGQVSTLLRAVMAGMRDARTSLSGPSGFSSYDAQGRSGHIGQAQTRFERRR